MKVLIHGLFLQLLWRSATVVAFVVVDHNSLHHRSIKFSDTTYAGYSSSSTYYYLQQNRRKETFLSIFGGIFGGGEKKKKDGELAVFRNLVVSGEDDDIAFTSLTNYIENWSKLFETDPKGMKLTTPVKVLPSIITAADATTTTTNDEKDTTSSEDQSIAASNGIRLVFQNMDTAYLSRKEEKEQERSPNKKEKEKEKLQGGVEILVEKMIVSDTNGKIELQVRARRCDFEEDTIIKEMSEETIVRELQLAIDIWKKKERQ